MDLSKIIHKALFDYWGYAAFRPLQESIITSVMEGQDTLAILPTGGGKSICYQVPGLCLEGICIVVSPLVALMKDQVEGLKKRGVNAVSLHSGLKTREIDIILDNCVYGQVKFLFVAPERLKSELFLERLKKMKVSFIAVDEAHCISQWGHDFRPAYLTIGELREDLPDCKVLALTASATPEVKEDIKTLLSFHDHQEFTGSFKRDNLSLSVFEEVKKEAKLLKILRSVPGSTIVYASTRKSCKELTYFLQRNQVSADYYHAGLDIKVRSEKQDRWLNNQVRVIVATNAFGMGIDKPDVRIVVHWDIPSTPEGYYQEAGRAGRDEEKSYAVLLYNQHDITLAKQHVSKAFPEIKEIKRVYQSLANYYQLAVGVGALRAFDFDLKNFCETYELNNVLTYHCLQLLEKQGFIQFNEPFRNPSKLIFNIQGPDLYSFQVAHKELDTVIKTVLRCYGAELFNHYMVVDEKFVGKAIGVSENEIRTKLNHLNKLGAVHYIPRNERPQVCFLQPRYDATSLPLNQKKMEERKQNMEVRTQFLLDFIVDKENCRSVAIANYFGITGERDCQVCDNCLANKPEDEDKRQSALLDLIGEEEWEPSLLAQKATMNTTKLMEKVRGMVEEGMLEITPEQKIKVKK